MRILVVQPTGDKRGHYGIYTTKLCQAVARLGHQVTVCTNHLDPAQYISDTPRFRIIEVGGAGLRFARFDDAITRFPPTYFWGYFRNSYAVTAAAVRLCAQESFDGVAIMDTEFLTASLVLRHARRHLPPVALLLWASNFSFKEYHGGLVQRAYKVVQREVFKRTLGTGISALAVLGEWHRDRLRTQLRLSDEFPVAIIPDGGDVPEHLPERAAARETLGLDGHRSILLFFGVLRKDKGIEYLLRAFARLRDRDTALVIAGWPMEYRAADVVALVRELGISERVVLRLQYIPDQLVATYFAACDALVLPYTKSYTGGSGPLLKGACTYGKPVIATDVSEMGQLVRTHGLGLLAPPEDVESLALRIEEFLALDEPTREHIAENAVALARRHSWDAVARRLVALFERLASTAQARVSFSQEVSSKGV